MPFRLGKDASGNPTLVTWETSVPLPVIRRRLRSLVKAVLGEYQPISAAYIDGDGLHIHIHGSNHLTIPWDDGDNPV